MGSLTNFSICKILPFFTCSFFTLSQMFKSTKDKVLDKLEGNNFSENMRDHVNGFSKDNYTCNYVDENSILNISNKHIPSCLKIFHLNIESFKANGKELSIYLKCLCLKFDIICLTEVRHTTVGIIDREFPEFHIFIDLPTTAKGGVALLLRKDKFSHITEIDRNSNQYLQNTCGCSKCQIESKWISCKSNDQNLIIGGIYRHPKGDVDHFNNALKNTISHINDNTLAVVLGDTNIDLLQENDTKANAYLNNFFEKNFIPCITLPTRITDHSATLIDHIFIKCPKKIIQNKCSSGNLITDLSDHLPNFTFFDFKVQTPKNRPFTRLFTQSKIDNFTAALASEPALINSSELTDTNTSYNNFNANYLQLFDKYFPLVRQSKKSFKDKPYITSDIKDSIKSRNKLYKKHLNNPDNIEIKAEWKRCRNKTSELIKKEEESYYKNIINSHKNSSQALWKTFGKVLNNKKIKHSKIGSLDVNGEIQTNPGAIANSFNNFFSEIGEKLANKFSNQNNSEFAKYLGSPVQHSMFFHSISESEINEVISDLKNSNSTGYDDYNTKFIKLSSPLLAPALEKIFNLSINTGVYPDSLKIAKVIPIFKNGSKSSVNNYRPISILSPINKIFEKIIYSRLIKYIDKYNLLYKYQYGFRKNHSTEHALIELMDQIKLNIGKNKMSCGIFIDLSKAFDTVDHKILLSKLEHYGIRGTTLDLLKSYLSNRSQYVQIEKSKSETRFVSCGVPQGSVLGPLLFLLFINDLPLCCPSGKVRIFADDTTIFFHSDSIENIIETASIIMTQLTRWFNANKLTLNAEKSSFTLFRSGRKKISNIPDYIEFLDNQIRRTTHIKFLGVTIEENLSWNLHINEICNKLKRLFHIFYNIRDYLSKENIKTIYYTLIYSRIKYGITLFSQAGSSKLKKIQTLQNQLLKVLLKKEYRYSTNELHKSLDILKVNDIAEQEIATFVHKYFLNKLPPVFNDYFKTLAQQHQRNTRNGHYLLSILSHKTDIPSSSMRISGAKVWNNLNINLKNIPTVKNFRNEFKSQRISTYNAN